MRIYQYYQEQARASCWWSPSASPASSPRPATLTAQCSASWRLQARKARRRLEPRTPTRSHRRGHQCQRHGAVGAVLPWPATLLLGHRLTSASGSRVHRRSAIASCGSQARRGPATQGLVRRRRRLRGAHRGEDGGAVRGERHAQALQAAGGRRRRRVFREPERLPCRHHPLLRRRPHLHHSTLSK